MSIFGSIASAIFGTAAHAEGVSPDVKPMASNEPAAPTVVAGNAATPAAAASPAVATAPAAPNIVAKTPVDVMAVLDKLDDSTDEKLEWSSSIVDLMKLLKLDSSLAARKQLAGELHYTGDMHDSAAMNVWLHKAVMTKLGENGGIVPKELTH